MVSNPGNVLVHSGVNCRLSVSAIETSERDDSRQKPRVIRPVEKSRKKYLFKVLLNVITDNVISQIILSVLGGFRKVSLDRGAYMFNGKKEIV